MKIVQLMLISLFSVTVYAQTIDVIKNSGRYIYGIGEGKTFSKADDDALVNLISQISVYIQSNFYNNVTIF